MDNHHLRSLILKLQDRLSDDDRRRLHFFLGNDVPRRVRDDPSLSGTLCLMESLFDQDKINEQDFTLLINAFNEIRCDDAVQLLRAYMRQMQSNDSNSTTQSLARILSHSVGTSIDFEENDKMAPPNALIDGRKDTIVSNILSTPKNSRINDHSKLETDQSAIEMKSRPILSNNPITTSTSLEENQSFKKPSMTKKLLVIFGVASVLLAITLIGLIVGIATAKSELIRKKENCSQEETRFNEQIQHLTDFQTRDNQTTEELENKTRQLEEELKITVGTTCSCDSKCKQGGLRYGICGDRDTCICRSEPFTEENMDDGCGCDAWCRKYGHKNGGICGDGYTCICAQ